MSDARSRNWDSARWSDFDRFNVVYLYGSNWDLGNASRDILTEDEGNPVILFGEIVPRFALGKITGRDFSFGPVKDVVAVYNLEFGSNPAGDPLRHLYEMGVNLYLPGFQFATLDVFLRDETDLQGVTWQVTAVWMIPFQVSGLDFSHSGFVDFAGPEDTSKFNIVSGTRLLLDAGKLFYDRPGEFFIGAEFAIWHNEFGIEGQDEFVPQLAVQCTF